MDGSQNSYQKEKHDRRLRSLVSITSDGYLFSWSLGFLPPLHASACLPACLPCLFSYGGAIFLDSRVSLVIAAMRLFLILLPWMMTRKLLRCLKPSLHTQWAPIACGGLRRVGSLHGDGGRDGGTTAAAAALGSRTRSQGPRSSFLARTFSTSGRSGVEANAPGTVAAFSSLEGAAALLPVGHRYRLVQIRCIGGTYQQSARKHIGTE